MTDGYAAQLKNTGKAGGITEKAVRSFVECGDINSLKWVLQFKEAQETINYRNKKGLTPLMVAASRCDRKSCQCLLRYKPIFLPKSCPAKHAPWTLAEVNGDSKLATYLKTAYDDECLNGLTRNFGAQLIYEHCSKKKADITPKDTDELKWLLAQFGGSLVNYTDHVMPEALIISVLKAKNDELAEYLINNYDVDLLVKDATDYKSVLHIAIENRSPIRFLITERAPELLLFLDQDRRSPFFVACMKGDQEYIEWLFQKLMPDPCVESPVEREALVGDIQLVSPVIKTPSAPFFSDVSREELLDVQRRNIPQGESEEDASGSQHSLEVDHVQIVEEESNCGRRVQACEPLWKSIAEASFNSKSRPRLAEMKKAMSVSMTDINDDSVFHILARQGNCKLLDFVYSKGKFIEDITPKIFLEHCNQAKGDYTPLQVAIQENRITCLEVMLKYIVNLLVESGDKDLLDQIADLRLLREVVCYGHIEMMKVLVRSGLWYEELNDTSLYSQCNRQSQEMLFLLMSVYAAVNNIKSLTGNSSESQIGFIQWSGLFVCSLHPLLLTVASTVIDQTKCCLEQWRTTNTGSSKETTSPLNDRLFLQTIGEVCLKIVEEQFVVESLGSPSDQLPSSPRSWEVEEFASLRHITHLNLASNELKEVPIELFLLPHLESLDLSNNQLESLPSVTQPPSPEFGVGIHEQDQRGMGQRVSYRCNNLRSLQLSNNCLQSLPSQLFTLEMLEELDASHNSLSVLPLLLWLPSKLNKLILHHNMLSQLHCFSIELKVNPKYFINTVLAHWYEDERFISMCQSVNERSSEFRIPPETLDTSISSTFSSQSSASFLARSEELDTFCEFLREKLRLDDYSDHDTKNPSDKGELLSPEDPPPGQFQEWIRRSKILTLKSSTGSLRRMMEWADHEDDVDGSKELSRSSPQISSDQGEMPLNAQSNIKEEEALPISALETLDLSHNHFTTVPWDLPCLAPSLTDINLSHNTISSTDLVLDFPESLKRINLKNCQLKSVTEKSKSLLCGHFITQILGSAFNENWSRDNCVHHNYSALPHLSHLDLSGNEIEKLPLSSFDLEKKDALKDDKEANEIIFFPNLSNLGLCANGRMKTISSSIHKLSFLTKLDVSYTAVDSFPYELGLCPRLLVFVAEGLPQLKGDCLQYVVKDDTRGLLNYLKSLYQDSKRYHCIKLMLVGDTGKGKTTLVDSLSKRYLVQRQKDLAVGKDGKPLSTEGVDISDWMYPHRETKSRPPVTFYTWDFAGQKEYYATHQVFLTKRSLYLLVFDASEGEKGILGLKRWLENIDSKASGSPVIVVGTHADKLQKGSNAQENLQTMFRDLYCRPTKNAWTYSGLQQTELQLVNALDGNSVQTLRDYMYDFVLEYKLPAGGGDIGGPLLNFKVPAVYIEIERNVREWAARCKRDKEVPIISREKFIANMTESCHCSEQDLHQATLFLHNNGILLHYTDAQLYDFYFIDPQWLSTVLAKVISIPDLPSFHTNGFMEMSALKSIFSKDRILLSDDHYKDVVGLMQKFDIALTLDHQSQLILVPSLLPEEENSAQLISAHRISESRTPTKAPQIPLNASQIAPIATWHDSLVRRFFLPYVPDGFFPRLVARIIASGLAQKTAACLPQPTSPEQEFSMDALNWCCWSEGFSLIYKLSEILKISRVSGSVPGTKEMKVIGGGSNDLSPNCTAIEVEVVIFPSQDIVLSEVCLKQKASILRELLGEAMDRNQVECANMQLAAYLLNGLTEEIGAVFEDWYPEFSWGCHQKKSNVSICDCCPMCLQAVNKDRSNHQIGLKGISKPEPTHLTDRVMYLFSLPFSASASSSGESLHCPVDGCVSVDRVAPDVEFKDLYSKSVSELCDVKKVKELGKGAYGCVYLGEVCTENKKAKVAIKEYISDGSDSGEGKQWLLYQNVSVEARIMSELHHPNVLGLVGVTLHPWCLLLEYAPRGDLKKQLHTYKQSGTRFGQNLSLQVMTQIAEAMKYLHDNNIIYRDLKPSNVLVWRFPEPLRQWENHLQVELKVADYGISKRNTPWGIKADKGTQAFQPPEAGVHKSSENFATHKFDVYSYGIVLYCLYSGLRPFDDYKGLLTSYVEKGGRPMLPLKSLPRLQVMFELMCWCWSHRPHHRPDFHQILDILKMPMFHELLSVEGLLSDHYVTAAVYRQTEPPPPSRGHRRMGSNPSFAQVIPETASISKLEDVNLPSRDSRRFSLADQATQSVPLMGRQLSSDPDLNRLISTLNINPARNTKVKVDTGKSELWYATSQNELIVKDYSSGSLKTISVEAIVKKMVSVEGQLWCCLLKEGICVYDMDTTQCIAKSPPTDQITVNDLLVNRHQKCVYALTSGGSVLMLPYGGLKHERMMYDCPVELDLSDAERMEVSGCSLTCGVVVPSERGWNIWCYAQEEKRIYILDYLLHLEKSLKVSGEEMKKAPVKKFDISSSSMVLIRNDPEEGEVSPKDGNSSHDIFLTDRTFLIKYNAGTYKTQTTVDFSDLLPETESDFATSLVYASSTLYVGTHCGRILLFDPKTCNQVGRTMQSFKSAITCMLGISGVLKVDQSRYKNTSSLERRERMGVFDPFSHLHEDDHLLVAIGMDYDPIYSPFPSRPAQLLTPVLYEGDQPPDARDSSVKSKHSRVNFSADCYMIVLDLSVGV